MNTAFKDHFSDRSRDYSQYRPRYPDELFRFLASHTQRHDRAWDCGTGSGQSAIALTAHYKEVVGTDASQNQIDNAIRRNGVIYRHEPAEDTTFDEASIDLITVAQALHWFDIDAYSKEVRRVLKRGGLLAAWCYGLHSVTPEIDEIVNELYASIVTDYWPPERRHVQREYRDIHIPLAEIDAPDFHMQARWNLSQLTGYLCTWSAVKRYESANGVNPVTKIYSDLAGSWGDPDSDKQILWPLTVRLWRNQAANTRGYKQ